MVVIRTTRMHAYDSERLCYRDLQISGEIQGTEQAIFNNLNSIS